MGANMFGTFFKTLTFGESHGPAVGAVIEGCPAGVPFSLELVKKKMARRQPGRFPWMSSRKELDSPELMSGVFKGLTLGTPITLLIKNRDFKPEDYDSIKHKPRPGHADDVWKQKFGHADHRGGGRASGRETAGRVLAGAVAEMFVKELYSSLSVKALAGRIGPFKREDFNMSSATDLESKWFGRQTKEVEDFLIQAKDRGLSYGGMARVEVTNPPAGLGQPVFRKLKSDMASAFMSIGACYEVSLGVDDISLEEGSALHGAGKPLVYGGIRGGVSTGEKIVFQLKFKPPASVLDVAKKGRHDPCIVPRALVAVEAMAWLTLADHILWRRADCL